jgi:LmbE family N-acetylglucosaminyl deacetylase
VILAHPDDESFGPGSTLARYAAEGVHVHYLCGTRGESGTVDAALLNGHADVAALRSAELRCAADALGLAGVHFLGYRDSGMHGSADNLYPASLFQAPLDDVADRIAGYFDQLRPDVVITHDQFGGYGHPDHIKLHHAVLRVYAKRYGVTIDVSRWRNSEPKPTVTVTKDDDAAVAPPLYFATIPKGLVRFGVRVLPWFRQNPRAFGRNKDIDLTQIASWDLPSTTQLQTGSYASVKERASACHASQQPPSQAPFVLRMFFRLGRGTEHFSRVYPSAPPRRVETRLMGL